MGSIEFLPVGSFSNSEIPYLRRNSPTTTSVISMNPQDKLRLVRYEERWRMFQGQQWGIPQRDDGDPLITANICRVVVNKLASWLIGNGMDISTNEALAAYTLPVLEEVWGYNLKDQLLLEMATMAGVTGDGFVLITYQEPTSLEREVDPYTKGRIRIRLLHPHQVFPQWDPRNQERLLALKVITEETDNRLPEIVQGEGAISGMNATGRQMRRYIEVYTPEWIEEGYEDEQRVTRPNALKEIPLVHWANVKFPGEYYGMSDLDGVIDMQKELNQKLTDESDIVHINAAPITVVTGARARELEKGPRSLWTFANHQARVTNLTMPGDMGGVQNYINFVMQLIYIISGVPEESVGKVQGISNTSAAALQMRYGPLIEAVGRKAKPFIPAVQRMNYFILRLYQLITGKRFPIDVCKNCGGRILEFPVTDKYGGTRMFTRCYVVDPVTLDFMEPDEMKVRVRRKFSFGETTMEIPYKQARLEYGKVSTSYWDPAPEKDLVKKAELEQKEAEAAALAAEEQQSTMAEEEHARALELKNPPQGADNEEE